MYEDGIDETIYMFASAGWALKDLHDRIMSLPAEILASIFYRDWKTHHELGAIGITAFWEKEQKIVHCPKAFIDQVISKVSGQNRKSG